MLADMFSGIMTVSFFSPKRYISEAFVALIKESVIARDSVFSSFERNDGELLYMPSWNLASLDVEVYWDAIPHEDSISETTIISNELFFIIYLRFIYNNFVSSQPVCACAHSATNIMIKTIKVRYNGKRSNQKVG